MHFSACDVDCRLGGAELCDSAHGADIFAFAAAYADFGVDSRAHVAVLAFHHKDGAGGAVAGAVAAVLTVCRRDAAVGVDNGCAYLDRAFLGCVDRLYRTGGTYLGAACALGAAVAVGEHELGLHESLGGERRFEHSRGAFAHAELACRAVLAEMFAADGAGGNGSDVVVVRFLMFEGSETAVGHFVGGMRSEGASEKSGCGYEGAATGVGGFRSLGGCVAARHPETERVCAAMVHAVQAYDAAAVVYLMVLSVDALRLAETSAETARNTFVKVYRDFEKRMGRDRSQCRADGADRVAVDASAPPCETCHEHNLCGGDRGENPRECRRSGDAVEKIYFLRRGKVGYGHRDSTPARNEPLTCETTENAVRLKQSGIRCRQNAGKSQDSRENEYAQERKAHPDVGGCEAEKPAAPLALRGEPHADTAHSVLKNTKRADNAAVQPAEQKAEYSDKRYCHEVKRQQRRNKLNLRHERQRCCRSSREVNEESRHHNERDNGKYDSDSPQHL